MIQENKTVSVLDTKIKDCDFTVGLRDILIANRVHDVKQILALSQEQIFAFELISKDYLGELRHFLKQNGLKLSGHIDRKPKAEVDVVFYRPIKHCGFKAGRLLISWDILTVGELIKHSEKSLLNIPGLGPVYLSDIKHVLLANGLSLTDNIIKSLQEETKKGMQLDLSPTNSSSKQVIELWIELNEPLLDKDDNQLMTAKCFLENINRR